MTNELKTKGHIALSILIYLVAGVIAAGIAYTASWLVHDVPISVPRIMSIGGFRIPLHPVIVFILAALFALIVGTTSEAVLERFENKALGLMIITLFWGLVAGLIVTQYDGPINGLVAGLAIVAIPWVLKTLFSSIKYKNALVTRKYPVVVDYHSLSFGKMIKACNFVCIDRDITVGHFPILIGGKENVDLEIVPLNITCEALADLQIKEYKLRLRMSGLRPATLPELLTFTAKCPEALKQFPIVATGSSWVDNGGKRKVPFIQVECNGGLSLTLVEVEGLRKKCGSLVKRIAEDFR